MKKVLSLGLGLAMAMSAQLAFADVLEALPEPEGEIVLTVSGEISVTNTEEGTAEFDLEMLEALNQTEFETNTIWTEESQVFKGVLLKELLEAVGAEGDNVFASALDDYSIDIPFEDAMEHDALLAYNINDEEISVREKGPIWIVYPFDEKPDYQTEVYYSRSVWQLTDLDVQNTDE